MGEMRNAHKILVERSEEERDHFEELCIDGMIKLECILKGPSSSSFKNYAPWPVPVSELILLKLMNLFGR